MAPLLLLSIPGPAAWVYLLWSRGGFWLISDGHDEFDALPDDWPSVAPIKPIAPIRLDLAKDAASKGGYEHLPDIWGLVTRSAFVRPLLAGTVGDMIRFHREAP